MKLEDSLSFKKAIKLVDFINALSIWKSSQNTHLNTKVRTTDFLPATIAVQSTLPEKVVCSALQRAAQALSTQPSVGAMAQGSRWPPGCLRGFVDTFLALGSLV